MKTRACPVSRPWLIARLRECASLSGQAFAFISVLGQVTGHQYVWTADHWYELTRRGAKRIA